MNSDPFDDLLTDQAAKNARAGAKFQPKAKPRPPKRDSAAPLVPSSQQVRTTDTSASEFTKFRETEPLSEPDAQRVSEVVNASSEHVTSTENLDSIIDFSPTVNVFLPDCNEDWHSCFEKSVGENADIFIGLESLGDFLPDSATVLENAVPSSEAPAAHVPNSGAAEELTHPSVGESVCLTNLPGVSSEPEISAVHDPLTGGEPIVSVSDGGCLTDNRNLETEEMEAYPCLDTLDIPGLTTRSGRRIGKSQPKSKMQTHKERSQVSISSTDVLGPVTGQQAKESVPPEIDFADQGSIPAFTHNDLIDFSSIGLSPTTQGESISEILVDEQQINLMEASHADAGIPAEHLESIPEMPGKLASRRAKTGKSVMPTASDRSQNQQRASMSNQTDVAGRSLRKRQNRTNMHQLIDESEDEALTDGDRQAESPSSSAANKDDNGDAEFQLGDESQTKKVRKKPKKPSADKEKPARKRKKDNEVSGQVAKEAPKKFSHSSRRRKVDKALLETPEYEIDFQKVPLRDLILLAEYKERMAKKEATTSQAPLPNQSTGNGATYNNEDGSGAFQHHDEDNAFASEQGGEANNEESSPRVQENTGYFNYQTYMDKTPTVRWSKQDTELFYEAVRQFGTDLSMIQQLFPGRTRRQVKLKYKKEERQHPLRLRDALTNRAKDHSHFELVIERLKQIAAEEKQNSNKADSVSLTDEEKAEEGTPETNDEAKSRKIDDVVVENVEQDFPEVQSPMKSYDSDDDLFRWSQYKSEDFL